jgi:hypothetical protein
MVAPDGGALHCLEPAAACRTHIPNDTWRVIKLAENVTALHTACMLDTCRKYLEECTAFAGSKIH